MLGVVYLFFSAISLVAGLYHVLYWNWIYESFPSLRMGGAIVDPDYLSFRAEFWGALLLGLCACLALEGVYKIRRASLET